MTPAERHQLIDALLEGEIAEADFVRLEAELSVDPAARREYYERVGLTLLLENEATGTPRAGDSQKPAPADAGTSRRRWRLAFAAMTGLAAALLVALAWQARTPVDGVGPIVADQVPRVENLASGFAVVSGQADAVWMDGRPRADGSLIPAGELHLRSGVVQLELFSGVVLVVEGDAQLAIHSPMEVAVSRGKVRARVPEPAHGFRLRTTAGEVIDLGTEFAVNATEGEAEVHVLSGEIDWKPQGAVVRRMNQGEAIRRTDAGKQNLFASRSADFVGPDELRKRLQAKQEGRLERWEERNRVLRKDPRLVLDYQVPLGDRTTRRLPNFAAGRKELASSGAVVAAVPAPDRWGRPVGALDFSPAGSRVRLSVPGEHRSLTLACWIRINSLDRWYNSLFLTDGHEQGEPHWQIMDDGRLFFSVKKRDVFDRAKGEKDKHVFYSPPFWNTGLSGQWLMIATVYDVDAKAVTHFLNGDVLSRETIPDEYLVESVRIGNASIGNWGLPERDEPRFAVRNLNGSLDEFKLFGAALSAEEIRRLYTDGKP
jgi:Concanavalin A-like lectin/glucanases superfamily/FecR protein